MCCSATYLPPSPTVPLTSHESFDSLKVLFQYHPEILITSPAIGRQGKALRRQQYRKILESSLYPEETANHSLSLPQENCKKKGTWVTMRAETESGKNKGIACTFLF